MKAAPAGRGGATASGWLEAPASVQQPPSPAPPAPSPFPPAPRPGPPPSSPCAAHAAGEAGRARAPSFALRRACPPRPLSAFHPRPWAVGGPKPASPDSPTSWPLRALAVPESHGSSEECA
eukprot:scaffold3134_cov414-Prasinococcus_capsulatus_cf.AAC.18